MEMDDLREIIRLLKAEGLTEITVCEGDNRITIRRDPAGGAVPAAGVPAVTPVAAEPGALEIPEGTFAVTAPLVGTFYSRPSPDHDPFVVAGGAVQPGDTICIIEAMKVMNEVKAERAGRLREVLVEDGAPVEYGQILFAFDRP